MGLNNIFTVIITEGSAYSLRAERSRMSTIGGKER
jgi:hypothetical protein